MSGNEDGRESPMVIGIVGGVASGKSTVARMLARRGAEVIDADRIAAEVRSRPEVRAALADAFGESILDEAGHVVPRLLAEAVFGEPQRVERLNEVMHPPILRTIRERIEELRRQDAAPLVVLDAPLLVETDLHRELCDAILFVEASPEHRRRRAVQERGMSAAQFKKRSSAQRPVEEKQDLADYVVPNDGSLQELERRIDKLWPHLVPARQNSENKS